MLILKAQQVRHCVAVDRERAKQKCLFGIFFENKILTRQQLFPLGFRQQAVNYCYRQYLNAGGNKLYLVVEERESFAVWQEDKTLRALEYKDPLTLLADINLLDLKSEISSWKKIAFSDRQKSNISNDINGDSCVADLPGQNLTAALAKSWQTAIDLCQQLDDELRLDD